MTGRGGLAFRAKDKKEKEDPEAKTEKANSAEPAAHPRLEELFEPYSRLSYTFGDLETYHRYRALESRLISMADELGNKKDPEVLTLLLDGKPAGVASFIVETNARRDPPARKYARIDLVIVGTTDRGLGLGRLVMLALLTHLIETLGGELYHISCLAAHPAVAKVLSGLAFSEKAHPQSALMPDTRDYIHMQYRLNHATLEALARKVSQQTANALKATNNRIRQSSRSATAEDEQLERFRQRQKGTTSERR